MPQDATGCWRLPVTGGIGGSLTPDETMPAPIISGVTCTTTPGPLGGFGGLEAALATARLTGAADAADAADAAEVADASGSSAACAKLAASSAMMAMSKRAFVAHGCAPLKYFRRSMVGPGGERSRTMPN